MMALLIMLVPGLYTASAGAVSGTRIPCTATGPVCFSTSAAAPLAGATEQLVQPLITCGALSIASYPVLSGTGQPGNTLSTTDGTWRSSCSAITIQGYSWSGPNGSANRYGVQNGDVGSTIVATVTACDDYGCVPANSNGITITAPSAPPAPPPAPSVSLSASPNPVPSGQSAGLTLTSNASRCDPSTWNPGPTPKTNGSFSTGLLYQATTFSIVCYNSAGTSSTASVTVAIQTSTPPPTSGDTQAPSMPGNFRLTGSTSTSIYVAWTASTDNVGVLGYELFRNNMKVSTITNMTAGTFNNLSCGTSYSLAVAAYDAAGLRSNKASITALTSACSPPPPPSCDVYDTARGIRYVCTPDGTAFMTPDGINPNTISPSGGACNPYTGDRCLAWASNIPPPAAYRSDRDYSSDPLDSLGPFGRVAFERVLNRASYNHDVCYGSQLGRKYCDSQFWKDMTKACSSSYGSVWEFPLKLDCWAQAKVWYLAVRGLGDSHYKPRTSSLEPSGEAW